MLTATECRQRRAIISPAATRQASPRATTTFPRSRASGLDRCGDERCLAPTRDRARESIGFCRPPGCHPLVVGLSGAARSPRGGRRRTRQPLEPPNALPQTLRDCRPRRGWTRTERAPSRSLRDRAHVLARGTSTDARGTASPRQPAREFSSHWTQTISSPRWSPYPTVGRRGASVHRYRAVCAGNRPPPTRAAPGSCPPRSSPRCR